MSDKRFFGGRYYEAITKLPLTGVQKAVLHDIAGQLDFRDIMNSARFISYDELADRISFARSTVIEAVKVLVAKGYLSKEQKAGVYNWANAYRLTDLVFDTPSPAAVPTVSDSRTPQSGSHTTPSLPDNPKQSSSRTLYNTYSDIREIITGDDIRACARNDPPTSNLSQINEPRKLSSVKLPQVISPNALQNELSFFKENSDTERGKDVTEDFPKRQKPERPYLTQAMRVNDQLLKLHAFNRPGRQDDKNRVFYAPEAEWRVAITEALKGALNTDFDALRRMVMTMGRGGQGFITPGNLEYYLDAAKVWERDPAKAERILAQRLGDKTHAPSVSYAAHEEQKKTLKTDRYSGQYDWILTLELSDTERFLNDPQFICSDATWQKLLDRYYAMGGQKRGLIKPQNDPQNRPSLREVYESVKKLEGSVWKELA